MHTDYFLYGIKNYATIQFVVAAFLMSSLLILLKSQLTSLQRHERTLKVVFASSMAVLLLYSFFGKNFVDASESKAAAQRVITKIRDSK